MQRTIKFKALRTDGGGWVDGFYCQMKSGSFKPNWVAELKHIIIVIFSDGGNSYTEVNPATVCQYTGLKDKHGKEIWEGDIFTNGDAKIKYVVEYHDASFVGRQLSNKSTIGIGYWSASPSAIEIIGNIHDTKQTTV